MLFAWLFLFVGLWLCHDFALDIRSLSGIARCCCSENLGECSHCHFNNPGVDGDKIRESLCPF